MSIITSMKDALFGNWPNEEIFSAVRVGNIGKVRALIEKGTSVNVKDENGDPLLYFSICWSKFDIAKLLIEHGADVNARNGIMDTSLHRAAFCVYQNKKALDVVKLLIEHGADVNAKDEHEFTPLSAAVCPGNLEVVAFLIEQGADIHAKDFQGNTPLHRATWGKNLGVMKYLVEQGADIHAQNKYNKEALDEEEYSKLEGAKI